MLKEQVDLLIRENNILKRAVTIQHERQKEYDERSQELQQLKQLVSQYQEQLRTLEVSISCCCMDEILQFLFSLFLNQCSSLSSTFSCFIVLQVNNYALTMHLRQAQQSNSIPGRFHPDVF